MRCAQRSGLVVRARARAKSVRCVCVRKSSPQALPESSEGLVHAVHWDADVQALVDEAHTVVLCTDDPAWARLDYRGCTVVDLWGSSIHIDGVAEYVGPS